MEALSLNGRPLQERLATATCIARARAPFMLQPLCSSPHSPATQRGRLVERACEGGHLQKTGLRQTRPTGRAPRGERKRCRLPAAECRSDGREQGLEHRVRASSQERQVLVGARGMGVGDERKLHHGGQAQAEDEEQHNDAASLPAGMSLATGERALVFASVPGTRRANLLLVNKKAGEMEHYGVPLPPLEYGPAFTAGERVLIMSNRSSKIAL